MSQPKRIYSEEQYPGKVEIEATPWNKLWGLNPEIVTKTTKATKITKIQRQTLHNERTVLHSNQM